MQKILVSACLLGQPLRYNATGLLLRHRLLELWDQQGRIVPVCPETVGGLPTPRPPAEINGGSALEVICGKAVVMDVTGNDVSEKFQAGAHHAWALCQSHSIRLAVLTESSPSCGSSSVHDGSFSGHKISGEGVTTALLRYHGVEVFNQHSLEAVAARIKDLEQE